MDFTIEILNEELKTLTERNIELINTSKILLETYAVYRFDLFCCALLNRTVNLTRGFVIQIKDNNFVCAAPLVRINLDSLLRLFAAFQVEFSIDEFAEKIIKGNPINKIKDKKGNKMTDRYLVEELSKQDNFNWVKSVYSTGSEHVHFTSQHIFASVRIREQENQATLHGVVELGDTFISIEEKVWATKAMSQIILGIQTQLKIWIVYKEGLPKTAKLNKNDSNVNKLLN